MPQHCSTRHRPCSCLPSYCSQLCCTAPAVRRSHFRCALIPLCVELHCAPLEVFITSCVALRLCLLTHCSPAAAHSRSSTCCPSRSCSSVLPLQLSTFTYCSAACLGSLDAISPNCSVLTVSVRQLDGKGSPQRSSCQYLLTLGHAGHLSVLDFFAPQRAHILRRCLWWKFGGHLS